MSIPRATDPQKRALKNLMYSTQNITCVLEFMENHGKRYLNELSVTEARDLLSALLGKEGTRA